MRSSANFCIGWMTAALAAILVAPPAHAESAAEEAYASASPAANMTDDANAAAAPLSPEESAAVGNALMFDPSTFMSSKPAKPLRLPETSRHKSLDISRTDKPDGSSTVIVKKPLATEWDTTVGADLNLAATPPTNFGLDMPSPATTNNAGSGAAWASVGLPNIASVDARVDPTRDQGKLGATFKRSVPVGSNLSVTLQNTYSVTETLSASTTPSYDPLLMAAPPVTATTTPPPQVWGSEKMVKVDVLSTGTSFGAGLTSNNIDPVTHNKFSADQKLYGPLHVTTAVTDVGRPTSSQSISAGLKLHW
jgi:hypothetical protein